MAAFGSQPFLQPLDRGAVRVLRTTPSHPSSRVPVVVLHGWGASLDAVGSIVAGLEEHVEVVALDLPGFGGSPGPGRDWSVGDYAGLVLELLDEFGVQRCSLLGHSFGARIALVIADETTARVERLLLTGAAGIPRRRGGGYYARAAVAQAGRLAAATGGEAGRRLQAGLCQRVASAEWLDTPEAMRGTFRRVSDEDLTPRLRRIAAPTLLVWGEHDTATPVWMGERMRSLLDDGGLVVMPGAGHFVYAERSSEFNRIAAHFLTDVGEM